MSYKGKKYIVLGMGISGRSAANYLLSQGAQVIGCDKRAGSLQDDPALEPLVAKGLILTEDRADIALEHVEGILLSPGVPLSHPLCLRAKELGIEIVGEIEFACRNVKGPCVGVTGTNGKTTVTSQIVHTLNHWNIPAKAVGNIGTPLTEHLNEPHSDEVIVMELSSYQLETMQSKVLDAAVFLNLSPDHLDRYETMDEYGSAKARIGNCLKQPQPLFISLQVAQDFPHIFDGSFPVDVFDSVAPKTQLASHDHQNLAAVCAVCSHWKLTWEQVLEASHSFKKDHHRIEYVATKNAVDFYDDSKGTNVDAVLKAVASLPHKQIVLIAGGVPKGAHFDCWAKAFKGKVTAICAIGEAASQLKNELGSHIPTTQHATMQEAVQHAFSLAEPGFAVLLSPGCASFDLFRDYAHRGEVFQQCVHELATAPLCL